MHVNVMQAIVMLNTVGYASESSSGDNASMSSHVVIQIKIIIREDLQATAKR